MIGSQMEPFETHGCRCGSAVPDFAEISGGEESERAVEGSMRRSGLAITLLVVMGLLASGCSYIPDLLVSNRTGSEALLEVRIQADTCPVPRVRLMPANHVRRTWRKPERRAASPPSAQLDDGICTLRASIPARSALEIEITPHYEWEIERGKLSRLELVSLTGEFGSIEATGRTAIALFEPVDIGTHLLEYGPR